MAVSPKVFKRLEAKERLRRHLEAVGGTVFWLNWNKRTAHYFDKYSQHKTTSL